MGDVPKNGEGTERVHTWGGETANRKTTAEREGWEVVLSLTVGGHEGGGAHRGPNVHKHKAEHGRAVYCYMTTSGPLQGSDVERGSKGNTEVVGSDGHRLGYGQGEGSVNRISVQIRDRHGGGGGAGHRKKGKRIKWGRMEQSECGRMGSTAT